MLGRASIQLPSALRGWLLVLILGILLAERTSGQVYEKVYSFTDASESTYAATSILTLGSDGNYYGTTEGGGSYGLGAVYKVTPAGVASVLVSFNGTNGANPAAGLVQYSDGNFYGATAFGGTNNAGAIFKVSPGGELSVLCSLQLGNNNLAIGVFAGLVLASDGNFYGVSEYGGAYNLGSVFKVTPSGVYSTIASFNFSNGLEPVAPLIQGTDGNLYGTTYGGGAYATSITNGGTAFQVTLSGTITDIHSFSGADGMNSYTGLVQGSDGSFYGVTTNGGSTISEDPNGLGYGTVFKVTASGSFTSLTDFTGPNGENPHGALIQGANGNFYGTARLGGTSVSQDPLGEGYGTIFEVTPTGTLTTLVNFDGTNGGRPIGSLTLSVDGNFIGNSTFGTSYADGSGTVFEMTPAGALTTLVDFPESPGTTPRAGLVQGSDGNFYGTTYFTPEADGSMFKITPSGSLTTLAAFNYTLGGSYPGPLTLGPDGNFYGEAFLGGNTASPSYGGDGTIFKATPSGALSTLVNFNGTNGAGFNNVNSAGSRTGLIVGNDSNFYGTTEYGGSAGAGTIFQLTPTGTLTSLVSFDGNGANPQGPLVLGSDGNFYGTTSSGGTSGDGTVFQLTPGGSLNTLVNFNGTNGSAPTSGLIQGTDGNLYGTTSAGGTGDGTIFKVTTTGSLTTLVSFSGTNGSTPIAALLQASDGNFYGTTSAGGVGSYGTIFQMTPTGTLTTLYDYVNDTVDSNPVAPLIQAADGNLYGTTAGETGVGDGSIYRLIFPGAPNLYLNAPTVQGQTSALFTLQANARGSATLIVLDYGTSAGSLIDSAPIDANLTGYRTTLLGTTLSGLSPGTTYYYQIVGTNSTGTTTTPVASFTTLEAPVAGVMPVSNLSTVSAIASATFNGTVNGFGLNTTVTFQYGTDGNTFPNAITATQSPLTAAGSTAVSAPVAGLNGNTTYYYRISATNAGGTTISGVSSFTTLTAPTVTLQPATLVMSNNAQLNALVNALGSNTTVNFQYSTDINFGSNDTTNIGATPGTVLGTISGPQPVTAPLSSSSQGTTYYYQALVSSAGGSNVSTTGTVTLDILSGFNREFPDDPPAYDGALVVTMTPATAGGTTGWRLAGEQTWRSSGEEATGLVSGDYTVQFEPVPGAIQPADQLVSVTSGAIPAQIEADYSPTSGGPTGGVDVTLEPTNLSGTGWRFVGETAWRASGTSATGLSPGTYLVECEPVTNQTTPATAAIAVPSGSPLNVTLVYVTAPAAQGAPSNPLTLAQINADPTQACEFVGQIRSDVGLASGFVVRAQVVLTAAHVIFDPATLTDVTGLQWVFQRTAGFYEPVPQIPEGACAFTSYTAERQNDEQTNAGTDSESVASQNLDVAALYFMAPAGRNGFGGYLASGANTNEFLTSSTRNKVLVGYPVDGIPSAEQGDMFTTTPVTAPLSQDPGYDTSGDPETNGDFYQVYRTTAFTGVGGSSGGPVCVQFDDGNYYPAGIYLGGDSYSEVRAIDQSVVDLINDADSQTTSSTHLSAGVSLYSTTQTGGNPSTGSMMVTFAPSAAAGATYATVTQPGATQHPGGVLQSNLLPGTYTLVFSAVSGYTTPPNTPVTVTANTTQDITATYGTTLATSNIPQVASAALDVLTTTAIDYQIQASEAPTSFLAQSPNGPLPKGLSLSSAGVISGKVATAGTYPIDLFATNGFGTGSGTLTLTVETPPVITTIAASVIGTTSVNLNATVNPENSLTMVSFDYGPTTGYGNQTTAVAESSGTATVTTPLSNLSPGTPYHFRAIATKAGTTIYGADKTFTTLAEPKIAAVTPYLSAFSAEITASITPGTTVGTGTNQVFVEYGTTTAYSSTPTPMVKFTAAETYSVFLNGLAPNTIYYYRVVTVLNGVDYPGPPESFTTLGFATNLVATAASTGAANKALGNPAISGGSDIAYQATLASGAFVLWADNSGGTAQMIAQSGGANAVGAASPFASFSDPVYNSSQAIAFRGTLASKTTGLWSNSGGPLALVAAQANAAPSTSATFSSFNSLGLTDSAGLVFGATITGGGVTTANNMGVWEGTTGNLKLLLLLGQELNGQAITKFSFLPTGEAFANGQTRGFTSIGDIIASVTYANKSTGLVRVSAAGTASALLTSGASDPITAATFSAFGNPALNNNDHTAFTATLSGTGITTANNTGLWADDSTGTRRLIARIGTVNGAPLTDYANLTPSPAFGTFLTLGDPVYNNNDAVAFRATLATSGTDKVPASAAAGIWCDSTESLALVAQQGQQAPGCPPGVSFATFTELALPDTSGANGLGGVVFLASLGGTGITTANNTGIWAVDGSGNLQLIVRTGDTLGSKTVTAVSFLPVETIVNGQSRSFDPTTANLTYRATFSDSSQAIYQVSFP